MKIGSFLKLVEIQTKVASVIPFLLGTSYAVYKFEDFNIKNALIMFLAMICFDMATTAINNYMDYKKAIKKEGYGYETHNAIVSFNLNPRNVRLTIYMMIIISALLGLVLVKNTSLIVLILGVISFIIGILYSFGPIPISRTPFGEILSGLTMGLIITFLAVYIHVFDKGILEFLISNGMVILSFNIKEIVSICVISIPVIMGIANIMLANNICDIDEDIVNKRYTLPIYIGKDKALVVFKTLYYIAFVAIIVGVIAKVLPIISLMVIISIKPINKNINEFMKLQTKKDTFVIAVKNFVIINLTYIMSIIIGIIISY